MKEAEVRFKGMKVATGSNRASVISEERYRANCREFRLSSNITPSAKRSVNIIGGVQEVPVTVRFQVPFIRVRTIIEVRSLVLPERVPSILSMHYMLDNSLVV